MRWRTPLLHAGLILPPQVHAQDDTHVMRFSRNTVDIRFANSFGFRTTVKGEAAN